MTIPHPFFRALWIKYAYSTVSIFVLFGLTYSRNPKTTLLMAWMPLWVFYYTLRFSKWYSQARHEENPPLPEWVYLDIELAIGLFVFLLFSILGLFGLFEMSTYYEIVAISMVWLWLLMMAYYWKMEWQYRAFCLEEAKRDRGCVNDEPIS